MSNRTEAIPRTTTWTIRLLFIFLLVGFARLTWHARPNSEELASSIHALDVATLGTILDRRTPAETDYDQQLLFWTTEVERILRVHPEDAELHAAGALVLDEPSNMYFSQLIRNSTASLGHGEELFQDNSASRANFDSFGGTRSFDLVRRATELDPSDPRWWRLRAVLLWPSPISSRIR